MSFDHVINGIGEAIDAAGVAVIVVGALIAVGSAVVHRTRGERAIFSRFREQLGQTILLGLELLVAADIVRTVAAQLTLSGVAILGIIVLIRTFLSFSLQLEITGRWPWQKKPNGSSPE
jgi:uncharacterized membrane protein